jgi:CTP:molybdopterin cytidylyltransferase MocA
VLLPRIVFDQLANTAAPDLKNFLHGSAARITRCDINDPGLDLDIDRPEDYAAARRLCP